MGGCIDYVQNKDEKLQNISDLSNGIPLDDDELSQDAIKFAYNDQTQTPICYSIMEANSIMHKHEKDHNNAQLHHNCEPALQQDIQIAQVATQFDQAEQVQVTHQHHIKEWIEDHMHHENHQIKMKDSNCDHFEKHQ